MQFLEIPEKIPSSQKRIPWIDIAKAIAIIAVVVNHAYPLKDTFYKTTYWWHMPLFFLIGGFFLKALPKDQLSWQRFCKKHILPMLRAYFLAGTLLVLFDFILEGRTVAYTLAYFGRLLYGGEILKGYTSAFWFITVYLLALTVVTILLTYVPWRSLQFLIVVGLFALGTAYQDAQALFGFALPWDMDVALLATFYMWVGWFSFKYLKQLVANKLFLGGTISLALILVILQGSGQIQQIIYMKSHRITNGLFAFIVPLIFSFGILALAYWLQFAWGHDLLELIGQHTLGIMFTHKALFAVLDKIGLNSWVLASVVGVFVPLMGVIVMTRFRKYYVYKQLSKQIYTI